MGSADRRPTSRPGHDLLRPYHDQIARWAGEHLTLRVIAARLREAGCETDHNRVGRYCKAHGIIIASKPTGRPARTPEATPPPPADPVENLPALRPRANHAPASMPALPVVRQPSWLRRLFGGGKRANEQRLLPGTASHLPAPSARPPANEQPHETVDGEVVDEPETHAPPRRPFQYTVQSHPVGSPSAGPIPITLNSGSDATNLFTFASPEPPTTTTTEAEPTPPPTPPPEAPPPSATSATPTTEQPAPPEPAAAHEQPVAPEPASVSEMTDEQIGKHREIVRLIGLMSAALQFGDIETVQRNVDRFNLWCLTEAQNAPQFIRDAAMQLVRSVQETLVRLCETEPLPLPDRPVGNPHLAIHLAERRYAWARAQNDLEILKVETEKVIAWLESVADTVPGFERKLVDAAVTELRQALAEPAQANDTVASEQPSASSRASRPSPEPGQPGTATAPLPKPPHAPAPSADEAKPQFVPLAESNGWTFDLPILTFGQHDTWTLQDACEGTLILGSVGSGKTSGSGRSIAVKFLNRGFGGLVLTAKTDEAELWRRYARETDREQQLCVVRPGGNLRFNFLNYLSNLPTEGGGSTEEVVEFFFGLVESFTATEGRHGEAFWEKTARQLLRALVRLIRGAGEKLVIDTLRRTLAGAPRNPKQAAFFRSAHATSPGVELNPDQTFFVDLLRRAEQRASSARERDAIMEAIRYWTSDFSELNSRTRSIVITSFTSMIDLFFEPDLKELLCSDTTIVPDDVLDGAVIVLDMPVLRSPAIGRILQLVWKYFFQTSVERRDDPDDGTRRPVFLWVDEAQYFWSRHDGSFVSTSRSLRCANVYLTQNIPNYYAMVGGRDAEHRTDGFFSNLNTKIFHANNDQKTNHWAAEQVGKGMQMRTSTSSSHGPDRTSRSASIFDFGEEPRGSVSNSQQIDYEVQPVEFSKLRTGSYRNDYLVEAYFVKSGAEFSNGKHFFKAVFQQERIR